MAGIVFLRSQDLEKMKFFYTSIGSKIWIDQGDCIIFKHDNFLFGFCEGDKISKDGLLTFFYKNKQDVDDIYQRLQQQTAAKPTENTEYNIYNFFTTDPEGRKLEFQTFLHEIDFSWENYR
ncbi:glyoxalase [Candidatus Heimdallarchaeota archaeon B3_Heim]|nr:MAG: glyoxalase [Candidatus Heimdallarchaeota archaeon B3_Heim]